MHLNRGSKQEKASSFKGKFSHVQQQDQNEIRIALGLEWVTKTNRPKLQSAFLRIQKTELLLGR